MSLLQKGRLVRYLCQRVGQRVVQEYALPSMLTAVRCVSTVESKVNISDSKSDNHISRYPTHNVKDLPVLTQEQMYNVDDKSGFIPNLYHALAHRPEQFKRFLQYRNAIMKRENLKLKKEDFELIGVACSSQHRCLYCVVAHSALHRAFSKKPHVADQVAINSEAADLTGRQRAILSLALAVSNCKQVTDDHFKELEKHGLDKDDAWDIAAMASFTAMASGMVKFLNVKPNEEYYTMGR